MVVDIEGVPFKFGIVPTYTRVRYGDPGLEYGVPGLAYGGLRKLTDVKAYLSLESQLTISQRLEPESGRGAIGTFSLTLIDFNNEVSQLISPGIVTDEILGSKMFRIKLGYQDSSYPEDYFTVFRGYATQTVSLPGRINIQLSDPSIRRKQKFGPSFTTKLADFTGLAITSSISSTQFVISSADQNLYEVGLKVQVTHGVLTEEATIKTFVGLTVEVDAAFSFVPVPGDTVRIVGLSSTATRVNLASVTGMPERIQAPDGTWDTTVQTCLLIDDELLLYAPGSISGTTVSVIRSFNSTVAAQHDSGADVLGAGVMAGNIIDMALKLQMSGFAGPWIENQLCLAIQNSMDPLIGIVQNALLLPNGVDAIEDYGLAIGDWVEVSGSTAGNNGWYQITAIEDALAFKNNLLYMGSNFAAIELPATSVRLAFRSQYDVLPVDYGLSLKPQDVDVTTFQYVRNSFLGTSTDTMRFVIQEETEGKQFCETELFNPVGAYSLTRYGRLSIGLSLPPIAGEKLTVIDKSSVLNADSISMSRGLNTRRFFNDIYYQFDVDMAGEFRSVERFFDTDSYYSTNQASTLPIKSLGLRSDLGATSLIAKRGRYLLNRYKDAAFEIAVKTNWRVGSLCESGDVVILDDSGYLQITNLATGERNLGVQLFEIIDRQISIKDGSCNLKLLSSLGYDLTDRYATFSPSSLVDSGSTTTRINIKPSFGAQYGAYERKKWADFLGLPIVIHDAAYTVSYQSFLVSIAEDAGNTLVVAPALPVAPSADLIVDITSYPLGADPLTEQLYKIVHAHWTPSVLVVSGLSSTQFTVGVGEGATFNLGLPVLIHNTDYSILSIEAKVTQIIGDTIEVDRDLGFTPAAGQLVELIGFKDGGGPYRWI